MEKIAIIDLGTNTFHLLVAEIAEGKANIILNDKAAVKIGKGGITKNIISAEAIQRALNTLLRFKEIIDSNNITKVYAIGTSAIRNARNGKAFLKEVSEKTGINITVISGEKEAEVIYEGVKFAFDIGQAPSVIIDIGGGSVEFIICNNEKILWKGSFEIGGQRLLDMFHRTDPIAPVEIQRMINFLEETLTPLFEATKEFKPVTIIGASGAFDTLCEIDVNQKNIDFSMNEALEYDLSIDDFDKICFDILNKSRDERMRIPGMIEMRVDMIVVSCILIEYIAFKIRCKNIRVCPYALKEGALSMALNGKIIESDRKLK